MRVLRNSTAHRPDSILFDKGIRSRSHKTSIKERNLFKTHVQAYHKEHNIRKLKDIDMHMVDIALSLEQNEMLIDIAQDPQTFRELVRDSIF